MATRSPETPYTVRREALATYFDSTAKQAWIDLTSDAKVSGNLAAAQAAVKPGGMVAVVGSIFVAAEALGAAGCAVCQPTSRD